MEGGRMKELAMMVGFPRSGKSTVADELKAQNPGSMIFSADLLRLELYGQRFYRGGEPLMWAYHDIMFRLLLAQGIDIILDETNIIAERRAEYIKLAKAYGYEVTCIWVQTSPEVCKKRAVMTGQLDVEHVVDRMASKFAEPTEAEGFKEIIKY
jgi:predicted kinase